MGCLGPLPLCSGTLCFWGEAQQGRWDQVDSHCRVEAAAGRVVETPDDGVQHKGHELKPKGRGKGFQGSGQAGRRVGGGKRDTEPRRARLHMPTLSATQPAGNTPRKTQVIDPEEENHASWTAGTRRTVQNGPFGGG